MIGRLLRDFSEMRQVSLALVLGLVAVIRCGESQTSTNDEEGQAGDGVWKDVRYPGCPEDVDPSRCERVIVFARVDYLTATQAGEWEALAGTYRLEYDISTLDGERVIDGSRTVWDGSLEGTGWWRGGLFSLMLVPTEDDQLPGVPCEFRVNADDTIQDANEPEPGIILCINETNTAAARIEYDRCSTWGPLPDQSTCPSLNDEPPLVTVDPDACTGSTCSCTEAGIRAAVANPGGRFFFSCDGPTTVVTKAEILVENDVTLDGQNRLTVDGGGSHPVFRFSRYAQATLRRMKITGGWGGNPVAIGGIITHGDLVLEEVEVSDNLSSGIIAEGYGVGSLRSNPTLVVVDSAVERNAGRGVLVYDDSTVTIRGSRIRDNGDIGVSSDGTLSIVDTVISGNYTGLSVSGQATVVRTTLSNNSASDGVGGGVVMCNGVLHLVNSTVSGNSATMEGGGIVLLCDSSATIISTTVTDNVAATSANGISLLGSSDLTVQNSIVAGTCEGPVTSGGGNLESPGNTCGFASDHDRSGVDVDALGLQPLEDNGGPTPTHAVGANSPAVDVVPEAECIGSEGVVLTTDQRGFARDAFCDVGAFEVQPL